MTGGWWGVAGGHTPPPHATQTTCFFDVAGGQKVSHLSFGVAPRFLELTFTALLGYLFQEVRRDRTCARNSLAPYCCAASKLTAERVRRSKKNQ